MVLAGGLTAQDTSTNVVIALHGSSARARPALPTAQHDAPAVALAGCVYVFGGGDGIRQLDHILRIDPRSGQVTTVGRLPAASSDSSAATIGATAYVVGGYTGTRWLNTIVAVRPGGGTRIVAHLPVELRYAAVAAVGSVGRDRGRHAARRISLARRLPLRLRAPARPAYRVAAGADDARGCGNPGRHDLRDRRAGHRARIGQRRNRRHRPRHRALRLGRPPPHGAQRSRRGLRGPADRDRRRGDAAGRHHCHQRARRERTQSAHPRRRSAP